MGRRRLARETALQAIYLTDISKLTAEEAYRTIADHHDELDEKSALFAKGLIDGTTEHIKDIDSQIKSIAANWEIHRMAAVDRSLLRVAAYELLHSETPPNVVIDEAIEIAKKFSSENSSRFINGILDKIKSARPV